MSGANSIFGHIHAARANAELWRAKVDDAERRLKALYESIVNGQAPLGSEHQFAVLLDHCARFKVELEDAEATPCNLEALQN